MTGLSTGRQKAQLLAVRLRPTLGHAKKSLARQETVAAMTAANRASAYIAVVYLLRAISMNPLPDPLAQIRAINQTAAFNQ